jgi:hypothetical protein
MKTGTPLAFAMIGVVGQDAGRTEQLFGQHRTRHHVRPCWARPTSPPTSAAWPMHGSAQRRRRRGPRRWKNKRGGDVGRAQQRQPRHRQHGPAQPHAPSLRDDRGGWAAQARAQALEKQAGAERDAAAIAQAKERAMAAALSVAPSSASPVIANMARRNRTPLAFAMIGVVGQAQRRRRRGPRRWKNKRGPSAMRRPSPRPRNAPWPPAPSSPTWPGATARP